MLTFVQRPHIRHSGLDVTLGVIESWAAVDASAAALYTNPPATLCPFTNLHATGKVGLQLFSVALVLAVPVLALLAAHARWMYWRCTTVRVYHGRPSHIGPCIANSIRAMGCALLLAYTTLLTGLLRLTYCVGGVPGAGSSRRLAIDGTRSCDTPEGYDTALVVILGVLVVVVPGMLAWALWWRPRARAQSRDLPLSVPGLWEVVQLLHRVALAVLFVLADTRSPAVRGVMSAVVCVVALESQRRWLEPVVRAGGGGSGTLAEAYRVQVLLLLCLTLVAVVNVVRGLMPGDGDSGACE